MKSLSAHGASDLMEAKYWGLVALAVLFVGCSSTNEPVRVSYDASDNRTIYRATSIPIPIETRDAGYGSQFRQLQMNLRARCPGRECRPQSALMTLSTGGGSELYLGDRTLLITADGEQFQWQDRRPDRDTQPERIVGVIARLSASIQQLKAIATAERVSGRVGSVVLDFNRQTQDRIRSFLERMGHLKARPEA